MRAKIFENADERRKGARLNAEELSERRYA